MSRGIGIAIVKSISGLAGVNGYLVIEDMFKFG
jgi:hypothetical protein